MRVKRGANLLAFFRSGEVFLFLRVHLIVGHLSDLLNGVPEHVVTSFPSLLR